MRRCEAACRDVEVGQGLGDEAADRAFTIGAGDMDNVVVLRQALDESLDAGETQLYHIIFSYESI
jgi:hypothetical protein